ncbi:hypothetical protein [Streptosporangium sp. NPDC000396]|uniref:hypothetical protein n=1 Tax=Streptosporangium sp. NPDC000396 TaxID=3366185 RepID=UPI00367A7903
MAAGDKHISSTAIGRTEEAVGLHLTMPLKGYKTNIKPQTDLPADAFGTIGDMILGDAYRGIQEATEKLIGDAVEVTEAWARTLEYARRNWRTAEDLSTMDILAMRMFV